ncbi:acyltransferase [Limnoglobus roseus]|uniref:Acyltransferase n=1 Tax=Limnoglobus roseus TaxID=2598579 RepID=A0A5C1AB29_9BACT|nr:acyltransferase [Limnoglobus roseus]QEL15427.1 acyltransferase [Limnoglobus roseus]
MKSTLKLALHAVAVVVVSPLLLTYFLGSLLLGKNRALEGATQTLALLPGISGTFLRQAFLSVVLTRCHPSAEVCFGTLFSQAGAIIDENVYVGPRCHLGLVHIEKNVLLAAGVHVPSGGQTHAFDDPDVPIKDQGGVRSLVTIGEGAWIGSAAVVMADVGRGSIIAAGAVVTKPIPDNVIAGGVPAKVIRGRFEKPT